MSRYPRFQKAIKAFVRVLPTGTYWRYANGQLPTFGRLITEHPELAAALAEDAAELAKERTTKEATDDIRG